MAVPTTRSGTDDEVVELGIRPRARRRRAWPAVLVLAVAASAVLVWVWHGTATDPSSGGYPQRIAFERPSDELPSRPGALAATLFDNDFGSGRMLGVGPDGHLWELPPGDAVLSPSGTLLLSQGWEHPTDLVVRDLVTGERADLRGLRLSRPLRFAQLRWSPDETAFLTSVGPAARPRRHRPAVVDAVTGAVAPVGEGAGAGFRSATEVVTVRVANGVVATTTDLRTGGAEDLRLRLDRPWRGEPGAAPVASVAPDGRSLLLLEVADGGSAEATVRLFSLVDGGELPARTVRGWDGCSPGWHDGDPVLPTSTVVHGASRVAAAERLTTDGSHDLVAVHPRLQSSCLQLTPSALEAGPRWSVFGTASALWTWYWLPSLLAVSIGGLAMLLLVRTVARAGRAAVGRWPARGTRRYPSPRGSGSVRVRQR